MIIKECNWRRLLGLRWISIQGEWISELNYRLIRQDPAYDPARWTGIGHEYEWQPQIVDWLDQSTPTARREKCREASDFATNNQAKIWFRRKQDVVMFKLAFGGQKKPDSDGFSITRTTVQAKSRQLKATWTMNP